MALRVCSSLGTFLLALCLASPAFAAGKDKKKKADTEQTDAAEAKDEPASTDELMEKANEKSKEKSKEKAKAKKGDAKKGDAKKGDAKAEEAPPAAEPVPEPDAWEAPPEEEEKPKPVVKAKVEEKVGDGRPLMVGAILGWGLKTDRQTAGLGADPYGLAMGLRGGYTFDFQLYTGVYFHYYLGSSATGSTQRLTLADKNTTASYMQFGAEVGYDWWAGPVIIRPSLQIGAALAFTDVTGVNTTVSDFMLAPGLDVIYPIDQFFVGGDLRPNIVIGDGPSALLIAFHGGMRFE